ncbi:MAG TPA: AEC family transporter [Desulfuromonadales bacterium]|nr:AEC family transporter [Desulfuromonadales bacterium]
MENFVLIGVFVAVGMLFRQIKAFPKDTAHVLNMFALYVSVPALVLLKVPHIALSSENIVAAVVPCGMLLFSALMVMLGERLWRWPGSATGVLLLVVPLGNTSFMGVPMIQAFFGTAALSHLIIYDQMNMLIFGTYGTIMLTLYGTDTSFKFWTITRRILLFPPTTALVIGIALRPWLTSEKMTLCLQNISMTIVPLVMTAIGFQLQLRLPRHLLAPLSAGLFIKLIAAPLVALLCCRMLGITGQAVHVSIMEAGMPPMVTASAMAVIAGMETELAVALVGVGIILSFGTLPLLYLLM